MYNNYEIYLILNSHECFNYILRNKFNTIIIKKSDLENKL